MSDVKPKRTYRSPQREKQAAETREAILNAADHLFRADGWVATTIAGIAARAGVSAETVYSRFGNKRTIAHELIIRGMRGNQQNVPMMQQERRAKVTQLADGGQMIDAFAEDVSEILNRMTPILAVIRAAAETDAEMAALYAELHEARRRNLGTLIVALDHKGLLREGLDVELAKDTLWSIASPELWLLRTAQLGATAETNSAWIGSTLRRLLLA